jgi:hypothetical protein
VFARTANFWAVTMSVGQILLILILVGVICIAAVVVMTGLVINRLRRAARRRISALGNRGTLQLQSLLPSSTRPISALRLTLQRDVITATDAVDAGWEAGRPVAQLRGLARGLRHAAAELDLDLAVISGEPDTGIRNALITAQQERIDTLRVICTQLRHGVLLAGGEAGAARVSTLCIELNDEIDLMRLRAEAYRDLAQR